MRARAWVGGRLVALLVALLGALLGTLLGVTPSVVCADARASSAAAQLTPIGANPQSGYGGQIPAFREGLRGYRGTAGARLENPYADDLPLYVITPSNYRQFAAVLSDGHQALFGQHSSYRMRVYPTRRSVTYPVRIERATAESQAKLVGADDISNAPQGIPFRSPDSGIKVLWNHRLRYRGDATDWHFKRAVSSKRGDIAVSRAREHYQAHHMRLARDDSVIDAMQSITALRLDAVEGGTRDCTILIRDPLIATEARRDLMGCGGQSGRMFRLTGAYQNVGLFSQKIRLGDMWDMFSTGFDNYSFRLLGKRNLIVPYNSYDYGVLGGQALDDDALFLPNHPDQRTARYELHRVWVVEAALRNGDDHLIPRRRFYVDEDSWSIVVVESYAADGSLERLQEGHLLPVYPLEAVEYAPTVTYHLGWGQYFINRVTAQSPPPVFNSDVVRRISMNPAAVGRRRYTLH